MSDAKNEDFKSGFKAAGLFGGVQVLKIVISIVNSKIIALLLGPYGMGIQSLLNSTVSTISQATHLGLGTSAVRDVSAAYASGEQDKVNRTITVFRNLVWWTGLLGLLVCALFSPLWSKLSFGNMDWTWSFVALSVILLAVQLYSGQTVILQGTKRYKDLAKANVLGSLFGLVLTTPLYYFFGIKAIVPGLILIALGNLFFSWIYSRKVKVERMHLAICEVFDDGKVMVKMGFLVALQGFFNLLFAYLVRVYVSHTGSIEDVGLYNAGFAIVNTYVGMVFTAMGTEYYPRLCTHTANQKAFDNAVNQQMILSLLLIAPLVAIFLVFGKLGIIILYSEKFVTATLMVTLGMLGVLFKAPTWCMGFTFLAKGDTKAFFWNELLSALVFFVLNIAFYHLWGLNGLGWSFLVGYFYCMLQSYIICHMRFGYKIDSTIIKIMTPQLVMCILILACFLSNAAWLKYGAGSVLLLLICLFSYKELNKRMPVKDFLSAKLGKH